MTATDRAHHLRQRLLAQRPAARTTGPRDQRPAGSLIDAFHRTAMAFPDRPAVRDAAGTLSYRELLSRVERAGTRIRALTGGGRPVGLLLPRTADMVVAALAAVWAGGHYIPIDAEAPAARNMMILADADPALLVTTAQLSALAPQVIPRLFLHDTTEPVGGDVSPSPPDLAAYVIYTSGTTGVPKGVEVSQHNVLRLFEVTRPLLGYTEHDVWSLFHSFAFDFSVWEMWGPLLSGGCTVIVDRGTARDPVAFHDLLARERVTLLSQTPTAFQALSRADRDSPARLPLRWVVFGGEALHFGDLRDWVGRYGDEQPQLINMYGITETTVHASYRRVRAADLSSSASLIGDPLPDLRFHLRDATGGPVPDGQTGELLISGPGVALGYRHQPDLTAQRFVTIAGPAGDTVRAYRSGDLLRRTPVGEWEYRGRADDQVKIRGYRIELGEIRAALLALPGTSQAAVLQHDLPGTGPVLVAYLVPEPEARPEPATVRAALRHHLPEHMIPYDVVVLDRLPLTTNGKLDRSALRYPADAGTLAEPDAEPDQDPITAAVLDLMRGFVPGQRLAADADFFDSGGHSLLATRLLAAVRRDFGVVVPLREFLRAPTATALAAAVRDGTHAGGTGTDAAVQLLALAEKNSGHPTLITLPGVFGIGAAMVRLSAHIRDRTIHALHTQDFVRARADQLTASALARSCLDAVLSSGATTVHLAGHSMGGVLAVHLAHLLPEAGVRVAGIVLLDAPSPAALGARAAESDITRVRAFLQDVAVAFPAHTEQWRRQAAEVTGEDATGLLDWAQRTAALSLLSLIGPLDEAFTAHRGMQDAFAADPPVLDRPALFLQAGQDAEGDDPAYLQGWSRVLPQLTRTTLATGHETMLHEPGVRSTAAALTAFIRTVEEKGC